MKARPTRGLARWRAAWHRFEVQACRPLTPSHADSATDLPTTEATDVGLGQRPLKLGQGVSGASLAELDAFKSVVWLLGEIVKARIERGDPIHQTGIEQAQGAFSVARLGAHACLQQLGDRKTAQRRFKLRQLVEQRVV